MISYSILKVAKCLHKFQFHSMSYQRLYDIFPTLFSCSCTNTVANSYHYLHQHHHHYQYSGSAGWFQALLVLFPPSFNLCMITRLPPHTHTVNWSRHTWCTWPAQILSLVIISSGIILLQYCKVLHHSMLSSALGVLLSCTLYCPHLLVHSPLVQ